MIPASLNTMMMGIQNPTPVLDIVGSAAGAWSCARKLSSSNTSPFVAQRGSVSVGGDTIDAIYNDNGNTDESFLISFIGANTVCRINTWNDQSGNSNNANLTGSWTGLPRIYEGSALVKENSTLSSAYSSSELRRLQISSTITLGSEYHIFCVQKKISGYGALISSLNTSPTTSNAGLSVWNDGNTYIEDSAGYDTSTNAGTSFQVLLASKISGDRTLRVNGSNVTATNTTQTRNGVITHIGAQYSNTAGVTSTASISEVIIYNRSMTTDERNYVESNLRGYYGV